MLSKVIPCFAQLLIGLSVFRGLRPGGRPLQPPSQSWLQDPDRPSIISATELKELDNLDTEADEGWAGERDYLFDLEKG